MSRNLIVDKNGRELKQYGTSAFPFRVGYEEITDYHRGQCLCHWHQVFELIYVYSGKMQCQVNKTHFLLQEGDGLFINSGALHYVKAVDESSCSFCAVNFSGGLLGSRQSAVYQKYVRPIEEDGRIGGIIFKRKRTLQKNHCGRLIFLAGEICRERKEGCEMKIISCLLKFWHALYDVCQKESGVSGAGADGAQQDKVKAMLEFMRQKYAQKIKLADMARELRMSVSECSHLFKKYAKEPPFEYLLRYRIERSLPLLQEKRYSISEIALRCGFSSGSYYARIFKRYMAKAPKEYQKAQRKNKPRGL